MSKNIKDIVLSAYEKFNARDIDDALALMEPDVEWANGMEGGFVVGTSAVRDYWTRQWKTVSSQVTPRSIKKDGQNCVVEARQLVNINSGELISDTIVHHVFRFRNENIASMRIQVSND